MRIGQTKARQQLVSRECGGAGVRLWGQGELSQGQPAALVTITNNELTGWGGGGRLMGNYGRGAWRSRVKGQRPATSDQRPADKGIIGLRPAAVFFSLSIAMVTASMRAPPTRPCPAIHRCNDIKKQQ